jgi:hypothetical protein
MIQIHADHVLTGLLYFTSLCMGIALSFNLTFLVLLLYVLVLLGTCLYALVDWIHAQMILHQTQSARHALEIGWFDCTRASRMRKRRRCCLCCRRVEI